MKVTKKQENQVVISLMNKLHSLEVPNHKSPNFLIF